MELHNLTCTTKFTCAIYRKLLRENTLHPTWPQKTWIDNKAFYLQNSTWWYITWHVKGPVTCSQMTCRLLCSNLYTIQAIYWLLQYVQCTAVYTLWYKFCNSLSLIPSTTAPGARDNSMLGQRPGNEATFIHTCIPSVTWPGPGRLGSAQQGRLVRTTVAEDPETPGLYQHHSLQEQWWY